MTSHYTHRILDEAGVDAVLDAAERTPSSTETAS